MSIGWRLATVLVTLLGLVGHRVAAQSMTSSGFTADDEQVTLVVGEARISIGPTTRFADEAALLLPTPAMVDPEFAAGMPGMVTAMCYRFDGGYLTLFEWIDGLNSLELSLSPPADSLDIPQLKEAPKVGVAGTEISISTPAHLMTRERFQGFLEIESEDWTAFTKNWQSTNPSQPNRLQSHLIQVQFQAEGDQITRLAISHRRFPTGASVRSSANGPQTRH